MLRHRSQLVPNMSADIWGHSVLLHHHHHYCRGFCHNTTGGSCHNATRGFCHNSTTEGSVTKLQEGSVATLQKRVLSQQYSRGFCHNTTRGYCHNATRGFCHNSTVEGSGLPVTQAAPANQNIAQKVPCEKLLEWPPCSAVKLKQSNRVSNCWILNKTFKVRNVTHLLDDAR